MSRGEGKRVLVVSDAERTEEGFERDDDTVVVLAGNRELLSAP
jgi:hypothetical protein